MADVLSVIADVLNQDKKQKKEQAKMMREVQKKLKEKDSVEVAEEPGDKEDYMKFFAGKLKKYGVKSPAELSNEDKKKFFNEIETDWKHDSSEEVEVEEKEENLGKRVKARMEAENEEEDEDDIGELPDEDEDPVGDNTDTDTDVVKGGEPSEEELEKLADLVVQKIKDKADDEEDEEEEPDATEAESGKEEKIDINPKMEQVINPHSRQRWEEALRQVYAVNEESVEVKEASNTSWMDVQAKKVESKWKSMNKSARKKWLSSMADMAADEKTKQSVLDDVLDDYGLTEAYTDLGGDGEDGTTTSDPDKDYGLHQFSDPKYVPAYTDQSFQTVPDNTGIGQTPKPTQSGTPNKAKGKATAAKTPAKVDAKSGQEKPAVGTKSDTPDKAIGNAASAKIAARVTTKAGVATQKEEVEMKEAPKYSKAELKMMAKMDSVNKKHSETLLGWIAFHPDDHRKLEITTKDADSSYDAQLFAIKKWKVKKSSQHAVAVRPAFEAVEIGEGNSGEEVAKRMSKNKQLRQWAAEVKKMKTVTRKDLNKLLPSFISGKEIAKVLEEEIEIGEIITEKRSIAFARKFYQKEKNNV